MRPPFEASPGTYTLEGVELGWDRERERFLAYVGSTKYVPLIGDFASSEPDILGVEYGRRLAAGRTLNGALIALHDAFTVDGIPSDGVFRLDYLQELSPVTTLFATTYLSDRGSIAARGGFRYLTLRTNVSASAFHFGEDLPVLYPVLSPGETGVDVNGSYRVTEFSRLYGAAGYVDSNTVFERENLRGHIGYTFSLGTEAPFIDVSYHRDELTVDVFTGRRESVVADRFAASATRVSFSQLMSLRFDHLIRDDEPPRTQLLAAYSTVVGSQSAFSASATMQNEGRSAFGATAESGLSFPLRWPYSAVVGAGAAYLRRQGESAGDGLLRLGVAREFVGRLSGWYARVDGRLGFSIGLSRTDLAAEGLSFSVGSKTGWESIAGARSVLTALLSPSDFGSVEGSVTRDGGGVPNVPILIDGVQRAVTSATGRYRVNRLPVGVATVSVQTDALEEGTSLLSRTSTTVLIAPELPARVDFIAARFVSLVGSVVSCLDGAEKPVASAQLALIGDQFVQTTSTSSSGGFEFESIPPGTYELIIDPGSVPQIPAQRIPRSRIELAADVFGRTVAIGCAGETRTEPPASARGEGLVEGVVKINDGAGAGIGLLADGRRVGQTSTDGTFRITLPAGSYLMSLALDSRTIAGEANRRVSVASGQTVREDFAIRKLVRLEGGVVLCSGGRTRPFANLPFTLLGTHALKEAKTDAAGRFSVGDIVPGTYLVLLDRETLKTRGLDQQPRLLVTVNSDVAGHVISLACSAAR